MRPYFSSTILTVNIPASSNDWRPPSRPALRESFSSTFTCTLKIRLTHRKSQLFFRNICQCLWALSYNKFHNVLFSLYHGERRWDDCFSLPNGSVKKVSLQVRTKYFQYEYECEYLRVRSETCSPSDFSWSTNDSTSLVFPPSFRALEL